jgi:serine/threonine-protein kinase RsbW
MKIPPEFGVSEDALTEVVAPNDLQLVKERADAIIQAVAAQNYDADTTFAIKLSLEEALTNAIKHGNQRDPTKHITLRYYVGPDRTVIMVADEGQGFEPDCVPDPTADENLERPCGRGLMLMQSYMSAVKFNPTGNVVWMLKLRETPDD